mmetsp:Transcript_8579/g.25839  ORF Transcript_8579/g.25839 Transcript_8579/m.25839 type:complete len:282 (-) Transcript_8579:334-1179(-)
MCLILAPPATSLAGRFPSWPSRWLPKSCEYSVSILRSRAPCADLESSPDQSPRDWSLWKFSSRANSICRFRRGRILWMCLTKISFSLWARLMVPHSAATDEYSSDCTKNFLSASLADLMSIPSLMSAWHRFTTPTYPSASGTTLFSSAASALVPLSMMSSLVSTPMVLAPSGSTCLARVRASELARSALAGDTANMTQLWCLMYSMIIDLILCSMSSGWFPTGTRVMPGRSTRVMVNTCGLTIFRRMGTFEMDFPLPAPRLVSASISSLIFAKFVKVSPGR